MSVAVQSAPGLPMITSASGMLAMLEEEQLEIKAYALRTLNAVVDDFWAEIAECLPEIEALYEDEAFEARQLAALLASKVFFQLGELDDALTYALGAGALFDVSATSSEYVDALLAKAIDEYCVQHVRLTDGQPRRAADADADADAAAGADAAGAAVDPRLVALVERMFDSCFERRQYKQALGIAIEARRLDVVYRAITRERLAAVTEATPLADIGAAAAAAADAGAPIESGADTPAMLEHCLKACGTTIGSREFRAHVLRLLVTIYHRLPSPDYLGMSECLGQLDDAHTVAALLEKLMRGSGTEFLLACQVAFDLVENGTQRFVNRVTALLLPPPAAAAAASGADGGAHGFGAAANAAAAGAPAGADDAMAVDAAPPAEPAATATATAAASSSAPPPPATAAAATAAAAGAAALEPASREAKLMKILSGELPIALHLEFLCRNNRTDLAILHAMKAAVEPRNALCHSAIVHAHALMSAGTTSDVFLRDNLDWLARATNWAKFSATASLGVIHRGHHTQAMQLLKSYLPTAGLSASPFSEGGALYALGLIHANHGAPVRSYLLEALRNAGSNDVVLHGACLALGLALMASEDAQAYDELKAVLYNDSAIAGEAAALGMGLVMAGSGSARACEEMIAYAHDTQHEKIIRALALGVAIVQYGREGEADGVISSLLLDQDDILRYGGAYALALAYAGTSTNGAVRRILDIAVSDVSENVRRAAVTALGFVLCNNPAQCPRVVELLAESYNPHVRYGATMAVGVACAGTGNRDACEMLRAMATDSVEYVRQGALIAQALVLIQSSPQGPDSRAGQLRKQLDKAISDKHEDAMTRFGAILASGLLEAGGRNVTIQLTSLNGHKKLPAIVGMAVFTNFWVWHPLVPFVSLALTPTALIGLNADLKMPKWAFQSNAPPSTFAYPPPLRPEAKGKVALVATAVLSTSAKAKKAERAKDADKKQDKDKAEKADVAMGEAGAPADSDKAVAGKKAAAGAASSADAAASKETRVGADGKEREPPFQLLHNPARVLPQQEGVLSVVPGSRYTPVIREIAPRPAAGAAGAAAAGAAAAGAGGSSAAGDKLLRLSGFVLLDDTTPSEPQELLEPAPTGGASVPANMEEPAPPAPFEFTEGA
ncbi:hypothetical protein KFE25_011176 [Diacronema lutheri]|uniref:26S proteasome non-ATPase regulatory subunit 1 homolog n=1 Tax=Diacronema lutheri TaxID=2081491 RepID=A0A8J6C7Y2_DIALT|nr:hypothetical protein KFE25_011176 [Diacronema lutheri]